LYGLMFLFSPHNKKVQTKFLPLSAEKSGYQEIAGQNQEATKAIFKQNISHLRAWLRCKRK
jgi:hypothetical protein